MSRPVLPPRYLAVALATMALLYLVIPGMTVAPFPYSLAGVPLLIAGVTLNLIADGTFKRVGTTVKPFEESSHLVTRGVYSFSRNPMYLGFELILLGAALLLGSLTPFIVPALFPFLLTSRFILAEEEMLKRRFGSQWAEYRQHVRRWI